jgi:AraC-like DNA-binding protein
MKISTYLPCEVLKPFVKAYHIIESSAETISRVLPDTGLTMVFRFKGQTHSIEGIERNVLAPISVSGIRRSARLISYPEVAGNVIVRFREGAGYVFFKEPIHEFFEQNIALSTLNGYSDLSLVESQLANAKVNMSRKNVVEQFLLSKIGNRQPDKLVLAALEKINVSMFQTQIRTLASELCISQDAFEKRFRRVVGVAPKQYASLVRLNGVIRSNLNNKTLSQIALDAGYFDQSHFNRDFKTFTGQTPSDFEKSPVHWR